ncbi:MAG: sugar ABC transporter permease [Clostridia bacterium]|nr:sugar ABC transporter permease [Clostridia bacterium]
MQTKAVAAKRKIYNTNLRHDIAMNKGLYMLAIPIIAFFLIFNYAPMAGLVIGFQDFKPQRGILGSTWVGFDNFVNFFTNPSFWTILRNTLVISLLGLVIAFPMSIVFALQLNEISWRPFKKTIQTVSYMPYFISIVVICGLVTEFCASNGVITTIFSLITGKPRENLLTNPDYFWAINLLSDLWQNLGYSSIIFVAAITSVSQELHEAAAIDGATRLRRVWSITIPSIMPTIVTMLILRCGSLLSVGFEKILLLYSPSTYSTADVISTHVQRLGIEKAQYGYSTAVGLFNSAINTVLLVTANYFSRKFTETSVL